MCKDTGSGKKSLQESCKAFQDVTAGQKSETEKVRKTFQKERREGPAPARAPLGGQRARSCTSPSSDHAEGLCAEVLTSLQGVRVYAWQSNSGSQTRSWLVGSR